MNYVGVYSSAGGVGSTLGVPEVWVWAGWCANAVDIRARHEVAL